MPRQLQGSSAPYVSQGTPIPLENGGTGAGSAIDAVSSIGGIHASKLGSADGVAKLGPDARLPMSAFTGSSNSSLGLSIEGPPVIVIGSSAEYRITNYNRGDTTPISVSTGTVEKVDDIITITPTGDILPEIILTIGSRTITIPLTNGWIEQPVILSPSSGASLGVGLDVIFQSSPYVCLPSMFGQWTTITGVDQLVTIPGAVAQLEIRGRRGNSGDSFVVYDGVKYQCGKSQTNRIIELGAVQEFTGTAAGVGELEYRFTQPYYPHDSTEWQISTDPTFESNIVASFVGTNQDLLAWQTTLPAGSYYVRCRYNAGQVAA